MTQEKSEGTALGILFENISILAFCKKYGYDNELFCKWLRGEEPIPGPTLDKILDQLGADRDLFDWLLEHPVMDDVR